MCLSPPLLLISFVNAALLTVSTFAGDGTGQSTDGDGIAARFNGPYAIKSNASGYLFVADYSGYKIRVISPSGLVSTLAGNGNYGYTNGNAASAAFSYPSGLCLDTTGNVYVADYNNHCIRMISLDGTVSTFVGSLTGTSGTTNAVGTSAKFNYPTDCEFDSQGNMYVVDSSNHRIRKVTPSGSVTTLVGGLAGFLDANGTDARFTYPYNLVISPSDDLYIAENVNRRIRKVTLDGVVTTLAGDGSQAVVDGTGTSASFDAPQGIAFGPSGDLYVVEGLQHRVRKVTLSGVVTTIAGTVSGYINGDETVARLRNPTGLAFNSSGVLFIADFNNNRIRQITFFHCYLYYCLYYCGY
ncbi:hypothetical protein EDD86DRAFT_258662 [Gorgonomyces haynaldii]|nr:hypothetical protein EDD86DRAFT_258662 [Gorgonomyces haynaldii]